MDESFESTAAASIEVDLRQGFWVKHLTSSRPFFLIDDPGIVASFWNNAMHEPAALSFEECYWRIVFIRNGEDRFPLVESFPNASGSTGT